MKKKIWKWIALITALGLLGFICYFANSMMGNPLSKWLAQRSAETYLAQQYPNTDYEMERVTFSFKDTSYHAFVQSPSSVDTYFSICIDMFGKIRYDTYDSVESGWNTYRRLEDEYRALTDTVFENPAFPYPSDILYGTLEIQHREAIEDPDVTDIPEYAMVMDTLVLDRVYDIHQLGAEVGRLVVHVDTDTVTFAEAARIMLEIREAFDQADIPFRAMDFMLQYPLPEEGMRPDGYVWVEDFLYEDLVPEGLEARLEQAHNELQAYYDSLDKK